jgi:hypothetical protein
MIKHSVIDCYCHIFEEVSEAHGEVNYAICVPCFDGDCTYCNEEE